MADALPTTTYYNNLGGVNAKASQYDMSVAQFLNLRNVDFDVPKALSKRPGSTQAISAGTSGPIKSLFEFVKLDGTSYIIAGSDTAMFYIAAGAFTLLSAGWTSGQPTDMLTFVNRAWLSNGQYWKWWDGSSLFPVGLPISSRHATFDVDGAPTNRDYVFYPDTAGSGGSYFLVNGATMVNTTGGGASNIISRAIYIAYSYLRQDGYQGPVDFLSTARNIVTASPGNTQEFLTIMNNSLAKQMGGFTMPSGYGISGVVLWMGVDSATLGSSIESIPGVSDQAIVGKLGWLTAAGGLNGSHFMSITLKPSADLSRFWMYTTIPGSSLFLTNNGFATYWSIGTFSPGGTFSQYDGAAGPGSAFSAMPFNFFATYVPRYQEINQNTMFAAGFSLAPSTVWFSEVAAPETYNPSNSFEVRTNDGDRIYAIASYQNQLIVMKENSFHKLIGDNADNYQLVQVSDQYGCISNKSVVQFDQRILWLDKKGILEFNGANQNIISGPIEPIFRRMNISAAKDGACGIHHIDRNQVWWGIPIDGATQNNITVVYDYLVGAWTFFDGYNPASYAIIKGGLSKATAWRGDYSGLVHYTSASFFSDSGQGISCVIQPRYENVGGQNQTTLWRRFFLDVASASGITGIITGKVYSNYDSSTVRATFTIYQNQYQSRAEMGVLGKAVSVELSHYSASLPLLINGFSWSQRGLRNV